MGIFGGDSTSETTNRYKTNNINNQIAAGAKSITGSGNRITTISTDEGAVRAGVALGLEGLQSGDQLGQIGIGAGERVAESSTAGALKLGGQVVDTLAVGEGHNIDVLGEALARAQTNTERSLGYAADSSNAALDFASAAAKSAQPESATMTRDAMIAAVVLVGLSMFGRPRA